MRAVALLAALCPVQSGAASAADLTAPPAGLQPAHTSVAEVLRKHRAISAEFGGAGSESWKVDFGSLSGTRTLHWQHDNYRVDQTLGPFHSAAGSTAGHAWHMNENGEVVGETGIHDRDETSARALSEALHATKDVTLLGQVSSPDRAYVLRVAPKGGRLEFLFYDTQTYRLVRREEVRDGQRIVTTYSDFHPDGKGHFGATHVVIDDGKENNKRDERLLSASTTAPQPAEISQPTPGPSIVDFQGHPGAILPGKIIDDRIILQTTIGGRPVDLQLDSGASEIVINKEIVRALNFKEYGRVTGTTAGDYVESDVTVPQIGLGAIAINNVHVKSLPFLNFADEKTPVAGLMGFDFIDRAVIHIDYFHGTVEAWDPAHFQAPAEAVSLPISLDDDVPMIHGRIGAQKALNFLLDTGADRSLLFSSFTAGQGAALVDAGLGTAMRGAFPFVNDFEGVGGEVAYQPLQVADFGLGPWSFPRWLFYVTQDAPTFEMEDYDGIVGQDVLRNYDVYLDYAHGRVLIRPNDRYRERFGR